MSYSTTYATLKSEIQLWMADTSTDLSNELDNIIGFGELRLLRDLDLEFLDSEDTGSFNSGVATITKPSDILAVRNIRYTDTGGNIVYMERRTPEWVRDYNQGTTNTGNPLYYAEQSSTQWIVAPVPNHSQTWTARSNKRPTGLSASNTTSWLSTNVGDALFYACLLEAERFIKGEEYQQRFQELKKHYEEVVIPTAQRELQNVMRADYSPIKATPPVTPVG